MKIKTQKEANYKNAILDDLEFTMLRSCYPLNTLSVFTTLLQGRMLVINAAKSAVKYWTPDKVTEYCGSGVIRDIFVAVAEYDKDNTQHSIFPPEQLCTLSLIMCVFDDIGFKISMRLAYIIWAKYVSKFYGTSWLNLTDRQQIRINIIQHFLFEDWSKPGKE